MKIEVNYKVPEKCDDCKFIKTGSFDMGRTSIITCLLTDSGDEHCDNGGEKNRAKGIMREVCPFLI
jgi:hypothetical protein